MLFISPNSPCVKRGLFQSKFWGPLLFLSPGKICPPSSFKKGFTQKGVKKTPPTFEKKNLRVPPIFGWEKPLKGMGKEFSPKITTRGKNYKKIKGQKRPRNFKERDQIN